jgi:hypothetical protein
MKKLLTIAFALLLGATLSVAQAGSGSTDKGAGDKASTSTTDTKSGKKAHHHKGGKKGKKSSGGTTTPPPK